MWIIAAVLVLCGTLEASKLHSSKRIVGGNDATISDYPYVVQFRDKNFGYICPGTIYNSRYIITSAYCIKLAQDNVAITDVEVKVGATKLSEAGTTYNVEKWILHENYDAALFKNNIGLLKLSKAITFSRNVQTISLPWLYLYCIKDTILSIFAPSSKLTAVGWGRTSTVVNSDNLQKVELSPMLPKECQKIWGSYYTNNQMCTIEYGKGVCDMDSGAPLVFKGVQLGIASFTSRRCADQQPDVYTRLCLYTTWIYNKAK